MHKNDSIEHTVDEKLLSQTKIVAELQQQLRELKKREDDVINILKELINAE